MHKFLLFSLLATGISLASCDTKTDRKTSADVPAQPESSVKKTSFGKTKSGVAIDRYTLRNKNGLEVSVINYGGIITSLLTPDKNSVFEDVVLGFDSLSSYEEKNPFFGALIGRFGNRIAKGQFTLDGKRYALAKNDGENHLHGGEKGFDKVIWAIEEYPSSEGKAIKLTYLSKDMEEGYPGNLQVEVIYTLTDADELKVAYKATTDKKTVVNLTQHSYFNLSGNTKSDILNHSLTLNADQFLPVDKTLIPTGALTNVSGTPFDFKEATPIGSRINNTHEQLKFGLGYDHCWVLNAGQDTLRKAATLYDAVSGRQLEIFTTEPGIQFYSGNFLDGSLIGKNKSVYAHRSGLCLETQHFPDSPNQSSFPSVELGPGDVYSSHTIFKFSVR
jgi:aldose 1-epimerase